VNATREQPIEERDEKLTALGSLMGSLQALYARLGHVHRTGFVLSCREREKIRQRQAAETQAGSAKDFTATRKKLAAELQTAWGVRKEHLGHRHPRACGRERRQAKLVGNTCPRCRRPFKNRNQAHSCGQYTVEQLLDGKPSEVVELYDRFAALVLQCGEVVVAPTKTRVLFKVRTVFATAGLTKNWMDVVFVLSTFLPFRTIRPRNLSSYRVQGKR
jgi:hypothetical protein